jgi:hypothetical protein
MLSRIRARLTYANVMATIAVFFALGGGAAYATHLVVRSSDIVNGEVRGVDVANDSTANALTGTDVSNADGGSLTGTDIRESTLSSLAEGYNIANASFGDENPLELTVPSVGKLTIDCQNGGTTGDDGDDQLDFFFNNQSGSSAVAGYSVNAFDFANADVVELANNAGHSDAGLTRASIDVVLTPASGPAATFHGVAEQINSSDNCRGTIQAVRTG